MYTSGNTPSNDIRANAKPERHESSLEASTNTLGARGERAREGQEARGQERGKRREGTRGARARWAGGDQEWGGQKEAPRGCHPGDNIRANGTSPKWTPHRMTPGSGGVPERNRSWEMPFALMLSPG
jgi:hypothetical protein